jgi:hypothetical protein
MTVNMTLHDKRHFGLLIVVLHLPCNAIPHGHPGSGKFVHTVLRAAGHCGMVPGACEGNNGKVLRQQKQTRITLPGQMPFKEAT